MAVIKFGNKDLDIHGDLLIDGKKVEAASFVGRLLNELEALKKTAPLAGGSSGSAAPVTSSASNAAGSMSSATAGSAPSGTTLVPSTQPAPASSQAIQCPKCEEYVCPSFFCSEMECCGDCIDKSGCDDCEDADVCPVLQGVGAAIQQGAMQAIAKRTTPAPSVPPPAPTPTATAVQPAKAPGVPQGKAGWDDFGY